MSYQDAQHLIAHEPNDDGCRPEEVDHCYLCGEPMPVDAKLCENCLENDVCLNEQPPDGRGWCRRGDEDACALCRERWQREVTKGRR